jgi:endonuclease YncB( thermonuclease family)
MWEMGNKLLTRFGRTQSPPPLLHSPQTQLPTNNMYPILDPYIEPPQLQSPSTSQSLQMYQPHQYYDYNAYPQTQQSPYIPHIEASPPQLPDLSLPAQLPSSQIAESSTPKKPVRKPRVTKAANTKAVAISSPKKKDGPTIFDTCIDASYTRPSGCVWPEPEWIPSTPYKNKMIYAKVVDVYDGDTITIIIMYGDAPMKLKVRVQGVDAPELVVKREKGRVYSAQDEELIDLEQRAGAHVRDKVKRMIDGKEIIVKLLRCDKYGGRQVGAVYLKPQTYETLTEYLLSKRYGKPYQAQKKDEWTKEELLYILSN